MYVWVALTLGCLVTPQVVDHEVDPRFPFKTSKQPSVDNGQRSAAPRRNRRVGVERTSGEPARQLPAATASPAGGRRASPASSNAQLRFSWTRALACPTERRLRLYTGGWRPSVCDRSRRHRLGTRAAPAELPNLRRSRTGTVEVPPCSGAHALSTHLWSRTRTSAMSRTPRGAMGRDMQFREGQLPLVERSRHGRPRHSTFHASPQLVGETDLLGLHIASSGARARPPRG